MLDFKILCDCWSRFGPLNWPLVLTIDPYMHVENLNPMKNIQSCKEYNKSKSTHFDMPFNRSCSSFKYNLNEHIIYLLVTLT